MVHFIIFTEQNTVDKCLIMVICDYFTNVVMIPIIIFVTLFHFLFSGKEIYYIQKQGTVFINHNVKERMIDYGKIIYHYFKRRYRGYLQQGNGLHSGKCPAPELSPGCFHH